MVELDYERIEAEPEAYFKELADTHKKKCEEIKAQTRAVNDLKNMIDANMQGPDIPALFQTYIKTILKGQQGTLEQALEKLGGNPEAVKQKQEIIHDFGNQLGQLYANAGFEGKTSKALDSARNEINELDSAYDSYASSSKDAAPVIRKYLKI